MKESLAELTKSQLTKLTESQLNPLTKSQLGQLTKSQLGQNSKPVPFLRTGTSCSGCGLNCQSQLRACVNMIKVQPSMKKVEEMEIRSMKSKHKRKLQRKWVPCGTFELQELCRVDSIIAEVQCTNSILPRWETKHRRNSSHHETPG